MFLKSGQMRSIFHRGKNFFQGGSLSGIVLLLGASLGLLLANSSFYGAYNFFWHTPLHFSIGSYSFQQNLHFFVNDVLMSFFFLVAGIEIRREIFDGVLSELKQAILPLMAALGGVFFPILIYFLLNRDSITIHGWAILMATDIAFAVGVLALLGRSIPSQVRIILLSIAVIDDIFAVLVIALFYSPDFNFIGLAPTLAAVLLILLTQWWRVSSVLFYIIPGCLLWIGLFYMGIHPSLSGVILGFLIPIVPVAGKKTKRSGDAPAFVLLKRLAPWVAFMIMPLFSFANAGVHLGDIHFSGEGSVFLFLGVLLGSLIGKPLGIVSVSFVAIKLGLCRLPHLVSWSAMILIGLLAGVGFTMSIFISILSFEGNIYLSVAKFAVLLGSSVSVVLGMIYGFFYRNRLSPLVKQSR